MSESQQGPKKGHSLYDSLQERFRALPEGDHVALATFTIDALLQVGIEEVRTTAVIEELENHKAHIDQMLHDYMEDYECLNWLALNGNSARKRGDGHCNVVVWEADTDDARQRAIRERIKFKMAQEEAPE